MVYLIIQGRLREGREEAYAKYLERVYVLMEKYGVEMLAVGEGFDSENTHYFQPNNAILKINDRDTLEAYLGDPEYLRIKEKYRDDAYEELKFSVFEA